MVDDPTPGGQNSAKPASRNRLRKFCKNSISHTNVNAIVVYEFNRIPTPHLLHRLLHQNGKKTCFSPATAMEVPTQLADGRRQVGGVQITKLLIAIVLFCATTYACADHQLRRRLHHPHAQ
jgi:hypothetical protein